MEKLVDFFRLSGKLKKIKRRGAMLYGKTEEEVESTAEHSYRMTLMAWVLGSRKEDLDIERVIKIALVHDLCEVFAGDLTPYDGILPKDEAERYRFVRTWPGLSHEEKQTRFGVKHERERKSMERLILRLDQSLKREIFDLWFDYEKGLSKEAKFVKQIDRLENLLQAVEYYEEDSAFPTKPWWMHAKEAIDDSLLVDFMKALEEQEVQLRHKRGDLELITR